MAFERQGTLAAAIQTTGTPLEQHQAWMSDAAYQSAYYDILRDLNNPPKPQPKPEGPKAPPKPSYKKLVKRRGRTVEPEPPAEPPPPKPATEPQPPPKVDLDEAPSKTFPGERGYVRVYERPGEPIIPPSEPEPPRPPKPAPEPDWTPSVEVAVASDEDQRKLIDEYGELDRRMQLRAMDYQRYETLKRAIKTWFDQVPPDADGTVEGNVYLLHLSARERERKIRDLHDLVELIGLDKVLELATVPIGALENILGKAHVAQLTIDARTGSRRIKAIAKRAVTA